MRIETVPIDSLRYDPENARRHGARNREEIKISLRRFGQMKPIVCDGAGVVRAGNGTLQAARELGWAQIDVVRSDLPAGELKAFGVIDNRTGDLSEWDVDALAAAWADPELGSVGFTDDEMAGLTAEIEAQAAAPDPAPATTPDVDRPTSGKSIKLTSEQREGLEEAFDRFRQKHGADGPPLSEGQIVVLVAADWMSRN